MSPNIFDAVLCLFECVELVMSASSRPERAQSNPRILSCTMIITFKCNLQAEITPGKMNGEIRLHTELFCIKENRKGCHKCRLFNTNFLPGVVTRIRYTVAQIGDETEAQQLSFALWVLHAYVLIFLHSYLQYKFMWGGTSVCMCVVRAGRSIQIIY